MENLHGGFIRPTWFFELTQETSEMLALPIIRIWFESPSTKHCASTAGTDPSPSRGLAAFLRPIEHSPPRRPATIISHKDLGTSSGNEYNDVVYIRFFVYLIITTRAARTVKSKSMLTGRGGTRWVEVVYNGYTVT